MTHLPTPLLPASALADDLLAQAEAMLSPQRMAGRASLLLARAGHMQALHAQALQAVRAQGSHTPARALGADVQSALTASASDAVLSTHHQLASGAALAHQLAAADPLLARLQAAIDGVPSALPPVIDVQATEVVTDGASLPTTSPAGSIGKPPGV